jgi:hypothetical protein
MAANASRRAVVGPAAPSFRRAQLPLREVPCPPATAAAHQANCQAGGTAFRLLRSFELGECTVLLTREFGGYHLSISHPARDPTWLEISQAWCRIVPAAADRTAALILPPLAEYVNLDTHCFQVHEIPPLATADPEGGP